jgi:copper resistance protein D
MFFTAVSDTALALVVGCSLAGRWLPESSGSPSAEVIRSLGRICLAAVAALILSHAIRPWFVAASMTGSNSLAGNFALFPDILNSTHQGSLWYLNSLGLALLLAGLLISRLSDQVRGPLLLVSILIVASAKAASGHAANEGDFTLAEFSMLLHILGTATWAGLVIVSGLVVIPWLARVSDLAALWRYGGFLSRTVTWALFCLLASGGFTSNRELDGSLEGLWLSRWGWTLMVKGGFVLLALTLGSLTRFQCLRRPASSPRAVLMGRLVKIEALSMLVILCLSAILAGTPPPSSESSDSGQSLHHH